MYSQLVEIIIITINCKHCMQPKGDTVWDIRPLQIMTQNSTQLMEIWNIIYKNKVLSWHRHMVRRQCGRTQWSGCGILSLGPLPSRTRPSSSICLHPARGQPARAKLEMSGPTKKPLPARWSRTHWLVTPIFVLKKPFWVKYVFQ